MTHQSGSQSTSNQADYNSALVSHDDLNSKIQAIQQCVLLYPPYFPDLPTYRAQFSPKYDHPQNEMQNAKACNISMPPPPANDTFDCTQLPRCTPTCKGPSNQVLDYSSFQTGCRTEWMLHALILRGFLSLLIYLCMNISRTSLVSALCYMQWRSLTPDGFTFSGSCSRSGKTTINVKTKLKQEVAKLIRSLERIAIFLFFVALFIHLPYLIVMAVLQPPQLN